MRQQLGVSGNVEEVVDARDNPAEAEHHGLQERKPRDSRPPRRTELKDLGD